MRIKTFQDLDVWKKGHFFVLSIYKLTKEFPRDEKFGLVTQIRRSASSICANIAEGYRKSTRDYVRFLSISQGSIEETKYHLLLSKDLSYISTVQYATLMEQANEIGRMLNGLRRTLLNN